VTAAEIFKTLGEVAGIGGLGLGLFYLIARLVLAKFGTVQSPPMKRFFQLLKMIIIFSFILAVLGLAVYLILELNHVK